MFKNLQSRELKRPFTFTVFTTDKPSLDRKKESYKNAVLDFMYQQASARISEIYSAQEKINQFQQMIQQAEQQGQVADPNILYQIQQAKNILDKKSYLDEKEAEKLERHYKQEYKDLLEELTEKGIRQLIKKQNLPYLFNQGFEDVIVCADEIYFINENDFFSSPEVELIDPLHFFNSQDDVDWIKDCQWGMYEKLMSFNQLVDKVPDINSRHIEELKNRSGTYFD